MSERRAGDKSTPIRETRRVRKFGQNVFADERECSSHTYLLAFSSPDHWIHFPRGPWTLITLYLSSPSQISATPILTYDTLGVTANKLAFNIDARPFSRFHNCEKSFPTKRSSKNQMIFSKVFYPLFLDEQRTFPSRIQTCNPHLGLRVKKRAFHGSIDVFTRSALWPRMLSFQRPRFCIPSVNIIISPHRHAERKSETIYRRRRSNPCSPKSWTRTGLRTVFPTPQLLSRNVKSHACFLTPEVSKSRFTSSTIFEILAG